MKKILLIMTMLTCMMSVCFAADLDQPMEKKVTLKTEIARGSDAIGNINDYSVLKYTGDVTDVIDYNQQKNKDTDGFYMGAYLIALIRMDMLIEHKMYNRDDELKLGNDACLLYYKEFRKRQEQYNVDDKTFCDVASLNYDVVKPYFDKYWAKTHQN